MLQKTALEHPHQFGTGLIGKRIDPGCMAGGENEYFVGSTGFSHDVDRPQVTNCQGVIAIECRVQIRNNPHPPALIWAEGINGGHGFFLAAGTKRAGSGWPRFHRLGSGGEIRGAHSPFSNDGHPTTSQWIQSQLAHGVSRIRVQTPIV